MKAIRWEKIQMTQITIKVTIAKIRVSKMPKVKEIYRNGPK